MKRAYISSFALAFALSGMSLAAAQDRTSNGNTTGSSVPRGGDGGGSSGGSSSGGSSGSSSSGSSGSSGSMGTSSTSAPSSVPTYEAPRRADEGGGQRTRGGGSGSGDRAVTRGSGGAASGGAMAASPGSDSSGEPRRAVPAYSRPRDGRPITGTAVERGSVVPSPGGGGSVIYYPYNPWGFWGPSYSYGLGYLYYDPFYYGGYGYGWGDPFGYGYGSGYGGGYGYGGGSGGYAVSRSYHESGNLRLKIDPKNAEVYVDGYYVGVVDSFDGAFQKLGLDSGNHKIEIKAPGFEPTTIDVLITPGETVTYKGDLKRVK